MKGLLLMLLLSKSYFSFGQNWQEWTRQKKTQIKYMLQQIAANQIYIAYLQKGYSVASKGLETIGDIKEGDFNLHGNFFESLQQLNPAIKGSVKVAATIALQVSVMKQATRTMQDARETGQFTIDELRYCKMVFDNLIEECLNTTDELLLIITPGQAAMKDGERLRRINALHGDMQNKYGFCLSYKNEMGLLAEQRAGEHFEIRRSKIINELK